MDLLLTALGRVKATKVNTPLRLVRSVICAEGTDECYQRTCSECKTKKIPFCELDSKTPVKYHKWVKITEEKQDKNENVKLLKRTVKKEFQTTVQELKEELTSEAEKYLAHKFREKHQYEILKEKRENLEEGDLYIWQDFSENYTLKYGKEVQSAYYGASHQQVTLHTGVVYLKDQKQSFCTASKSSRKDPAAIVAHVTPVLKKFLKPGITKVHFQSDSPTTQYRNKTMFFLFAEYLPSIFPQITKMYYNYTEAGHGKGPPDGVGAAIKTAADDGVKNGQDVDTFDALISVLQKKCEKIDIGIVEEAEIKKVDKVVPPSIQPFAGTMSVHQLTWVKEYRDRIHMNSVSCYLCEAGTDYGHFKLQNSPWMTEKPRKVNHDQSQTPFNQGDWVCVKYGLYWYPGFVEKVYNKKISVDFLAKHETKEDLFLWPKKPDKQSILKTDVFFKLNRPPQPVDRQHFLIPEHGYIDSQMKA